MLGVAKLGPVIAGIAILAMCGVANSKEPNCAGSNRWPTVMAFAHLKNAGLVANETVDFGQTKTVRLASQKIGQGLYRQVHRVVFSQYSGEKVEVITVNSASFQECSESEVEVYVVARRLGAQ